jgi:hypothetical protein
MINDNIIVIKNNDNIQIKNILSINDVFNINKDIIDISKIELDDFYDFDKKLLLSFYEKNEISNIELFIFYFILLYNKYRILKQLDVSFMLTTKMMYRINSIKYKDIIEYVKESTSSLNPFTLDYKDSLKVQELRKQNI